MLLATLFSTLLVFTIKDVSGLNQDLIINNLIKLETENIWQTVQDELPSLDLDLQLLMIDASSKFITGIFAGNAFDLGNFDQCYNLKQDDIYGKYCLGTLPLSVLGDLINDLNNTETTPSNNIIPKPRFMSLGPQYMGYHWVVCIPSNMSASEISSEYFFYYEDLCYSKASEKELSAGAITMIVFLGSFAVIILLSTIYDIALYYKKREPLHELLIAFSFLSNGRKLFKSTTNPDQLLCLNGIRAISMMWVILGHSYSGIMDAPITNFLDLTDWRNKAGNMYVMGATVAVDTFFVVGSLVTVYAFLKAKEKGIPSNIPLYYLHRYLKLTPALLVVIVVHLTLLEYFGNGPLWKLLDMEIIQQCEKSFWHTILYITNYVKEGSCPAQTWYLSVDMQLFILSPIVLLPLAIKPILGLGHLGFLTILGCVIPFTIGYTQELKSMQAEDAITFSYTYYYQTYTRFGPYVIGMLAGYFIYKIKKNNIKIELNWLIALGLWIICLGGLAACVFAGFDINKETTDDLIGNSLYLAFNRPAWGAAVAGVILLCVTGYGGPIDGFLSLAIFQFISKVSYAMYLIHATVITARYFSLKNVIKFSDFFIMHAYWGDFMLTLLLSVLLCLSFESPIIVLEKHLFGLARRKANDGKKIQA